ncbi:MAG: fibronectin type III domain-containing protein [Patescibacteria group bacterium]|nr:fibronectin type III domain-containing protein [Patescibacteria group bacterium]
MISKVISFAIVLLIIASAANSQEMKLDWEDIGSRPVSESDCTIYIGIESHKYSEKFHCKKKTLAINIGKLPLQVNSPNFISAKIDGDHVYSSEIIILWTSDDLDSDNDGLTDEFEKQVTHTLPNKKDSDDDGIPDGEEYATWGKKWNIDFDEDGKINILDKDSDNDGIPDGKDHEIRRITSLFQTSQALLSSGQHAFVHLFKKTKVASDFRNGKCQATLKWDPGHTSGHTSRPTRYRIYSREKNKPYNYNLWEVETLKTTALVKKLKEKIGYYFVIRAVSPTGAFADSAEFFFVASKDKYDQ